MRRNEKQKWFHLSLFSFLFLLCPLFSLLPLETRSNIVDIVIVPPASYSFPSSHVNCVLGVY